MYTPTMIHTLFMKNIYCMSVKKLCHAFTCQVHYLLVNISSTHYNISCQGEVRNCVPLLVTKLETRYLIFSNDLILNKLPTISMTRTLGFDIGGILWKTTNLMWQYSAQHIDVILVIWFRDTFPLNSDQITLIFIPFIENGIAHILVYC